MNIRQFVTFTLIVVFVNILAFTALLSSPIQPKAEEIATDSVYSQVLSPSYKLFSGNRGICSSTVIQSKIIDAKAETYILTAAHCEAPGLNIRKQVLDKKLDVISERIYYLKKFRLFKDKDVAVYEVLDKEELFPVALIADKETKVSMGRELWAVGFPKGLELTLTKGEYTGQAKLGENIFTRATVPVTGGNSGGGLFLKTSEGYKVYGVTSAGYKDTSFMNYFVLLESIHRAIPKVK